MTKNHQYGSGLLLRMHPLQRVGISLAFAAIAYFIIKNLNNNTLFIIISTWSAFALSYLATSWVVLFSRNISQLKKYAKKEDGSRFYVLLFTVITSFSAIITALLLVTGSSNDEENKILMAIVGFISILLSWAMVHTILTFHYAHLYYDDDKAVKLQHKEGLKFPGGTDPDYIDFAYFSFVVGMTFQVSDVQVTDKLMRRLALTHALISFLLNTFVVALTINFIAGLKT